MAIKGKDMRGSGSKANVGRKKLGKVNLTVRVLPENIQKVKDFVKSLNTKNYDNQKLTQANQGIGI